MTHIYQKRILLYFFKTLDGYHSKIILIILEDSVKFARMTVLLLFCVMLGFPSFNADAQFDKLKKKVEKAVNKDDKDKKDKKEKKSAKIEKKNNKDNKKEEKKENKEEKAAEDIKVFSENFGTGIRKTGGTCAWIDLNTVNDTDILQFKCISGKCNTAAVHGRTSGGVWKSLYQGKLKELKTGEILGGKRSSYTHLVVSVNGAHESYNKTAAKMGIIIAAGKSETPVKNDTVAKQEDKKDGSAAKYKIGDKGPAGGWIFYINPNYKKDGWRYIETAPEDFVGDGDVQWGCYRDRRSIAGAKGTAVGTGKSNSNAIIKGCSASNAAARIVLSFSYGGKKDWFLPSIDELELMETNLYEKGIGGFKPYGYWSSSESEATKGYARIFGYEKKPSILFKDSTNVIRAVRVFSDYD
ncbi:MAG TPA: hypothetical protein PK906_18320 [Spirochaetota bacterium]|nr:hypothetical protein [Spirochaetota bacterium]